MIAVLVALALAGQVEAKDPEWRKGGEHLFYCAVPRAQLKAAVFEKRTPDRRMRLVVNRRLSELRCSTDGQQCVIKLRYAHRERLPEDWRAWLRDNAAQRCRRGSSAFDALLATRPALWKPEP
jgi:hypothetical protein